MHYQSGSWHMPWGMPVQKIVTMSYPQLGSQNAVTISPFAVNNNASFTCPFLPNQHPSDMNKNAGATTQEQAASGPHSYKHACIYSDSVGTFTCSNTSTNLQHNTSAVVSAQPTLLISPSVPRTNVLNGHGHCLEHFQGVQMQNIHIQHANTLLPSADSLFSSAAWRSYLTCSPASALSNSLGGVVNKATPSDCAQQSAQLKNQQSIQHKQSHKNLPTEINLNIDVIALRHQVNNINAANNISIPLNKLLTPNIKNFPNPEKRKADDSELFKDLKKAKLETKALKAKRPGFTDDRYHETSYYIEYGLRKVYPYYFTFTTFTKGRWVGEKILDVFTREFRAHPSEEYGRCIESGTLTVNYEKVPVDYRLKHNDLLANIVHRHEVPVTSQPITIVHMDEEIAVVNKPASIPVHPCGRYRHNTVVFILAKEYNLKNLRTIHRLDRLTSGLLLFGRSPKKARQIEQQIRNRQVQKEYICRVEGDFPEGIIECNERIEVISYKIGVCKVSPKGKDCTTSFKKISYNGKSSVVLCKPLTGRMHQIRVHLQYLGFPVVNDPLYNHEVFGPLKGRGGDIGGKTDEDLVRDLINIHNAENWLGFDGDSNTPVFSTTKRSSAADSINLSSEDAGIAIYDDDFVRTSNSSSATNSAHIGVASRFHPKSCVKNTKAVDLNSFVSFEINNSNDIQEKNESYSNIKVTVATQTGHDSPDTTFNAEKMTLDKNCYECKVRYRDPKPNDLVMYLHAWKYKGPGWEYETMLPNWGNSDWTDIHNSL